MKGQKGEGTKQNKVKGTLGATECGPLFPRLHVNETEKAGPKAPPRNKMALYEQFTVPSHRFVQPSQKPAATMYQQQYGMRELGYPYVPYYMASGPNHEVSMYPQSSHNTSGSGVISDDAVNEEARHNASRQQKSGKSSPCRVSRHVTDATADCLVKSLPVHKDKAAVIPAQSSLTNQAEEFTNSLRNAPSDMDVPHVTDITESLQETLSTVEVGTDCLGPDVRMCESSEGQVLVSCTRSTCLTDENNVKQAAQLSIFEKLTRPTQKGTPGPLDKSTVQSCLQTESPRDVCKVDCALTSQLHCTAQCGTFIEPKGLEERSNVNAHCQGSPSAKNQAIIDVKFSTSSGVSSENNLNKNASNVSTTDFAKADYMEDEFPKPSAATSEELDLVPNRASEASQTVQCGTAKEGHSDFSVLPSFSLDKEWVIKPKNVMRAIGQQQFWKARKKLLRQQRIFSDQVFQLHKLNKIQQLLAETPGLLLDEEMHFETEEGCDAITTLAKRATGCIEDALNNNEGSKCKSFEAEDQGNKKREQVQEDGKAGLGSNACRPELSSVGLSAWGYPSLGPWAGTMAAQGGPYNYLPFAGAFPPGSAFGLPMGPSFPGSMMSFGIPFYDGRQEPPAEVDSNDGPPGASKHEGSGTGSVNSNHGSNDLAASWYFAQYNHQGNNNRLFAGGSYKDAPTGSGASVNNSFAAAQAVKAPCFPKLPYQWGLNCQTGLVNTDGNEISAHQSDHSSVPISATRLDGHTLSTLSTPLTKPLRLPRQDAEDVLQNLDPASSHRFNSLNQHDSCKKTLEREMPEIRTSSLLKHHHQESVCSSVDFPSVGVNRSALELFPLVPLNSCGGRVLNAGEERRGGVIRAVPRRAVAASKSAAGILLSLQRERQN